MGEDGTNTEKRESKNNENESVKEETRNSRLYKLSLRVVGLFIKLIRSPLFPVFSILIVIIINVYVFIYGGLANGFRALVAEGTISLALVTYLQMKNAKNQTKV